MDVGVQLGGGRGAGGGRHQQPSPPLAGGSLVTSSSTDIGNTDHRLGRQMCTDERFASLSSSVPLGVKHDFKGLYPPIHYLSINLVYLPIYPFFFFVYTQNRNAQIAEAPETGVVLSKYRDKIGLRTL